MSAEMEIGICSTGLECVELFYEIPKHLEGCNIPKLRENDLALLDHELRENGSSLEEKVASGVIWRMRFPGMIVDVKKLNYNGRSVKLAVSPIHPHRADLAYKMDRTLSRNVAPLTVTALLKSAEGSFVLGIRGGNVESGKIGIIPGGHTDYLFPLVTDPSETLMTEFREELGYTLDAKDVPIFGLFTNRDAKGINVMYTVQTKLTFHEILENWRKAKDRAEHCSLFQATYEDVKQLAQTGKLVLNCREVTTTLFFQDCFKLYTEYY